MFAGVPCVCMEQKYSDNMNQIKNRIKNEAKFTAKRTNTAVTGVSEIILTVNWWDGVALYQAVSVPPLVFFFYR